MTNNNYTKSNNDHSGSRNNAPLSLLCAEQLRLARSSRSLVEPLQQESSRAITLARLSSILTEVLWTIDNEFDGEDDDSDFDGRFNERR